MALETLLGVKEIGGFPVLSIHKELSIEEYMSIENKPFIQINHKFNTINFKIQDGPIGESGANGCQVLTMIQTAKIILEKLDEKYPCIENIISIHALNTAIKAQDDRTKDRERRNVEGKSEL